MSFDRVSIWLETSCNSCICSNSFVELRRSAALAINEMKSFDSNPDRYRPPRHKKKRKVVECKADEVNSVLIGQPFTRG